MELKSNMEQYYDKDVRKIWNKKVVRIKLRMKVKGEII